MWCCLNNRRTLVYHVLNSFSCYRNRVQNLGLSYRFFVYSRVVEIGRIGEFFFFCLLLLLKFFLQELEVLLNPLRTVFFLSRLKVRLDLLIDFLQVGNEVRVLCNLLDMRSVWRRGHISVKETLIIVKKLLSRVHRAFLFLYSSCSCEYLLLFPVLSRSSFRRKLLFENFLLLRRLYLHTFFAIFFPERIFVLQVLDWLGFDNWRRLSQSYLVDWIFYLEYCLLQGLA